MADFMNRDIDEQINCAKAFEKSVTNIENEIAAKRIILQKWSGELDPGSMRAIEKFEEMVGKLQIQLEEYKNLAKQLRDNGERVKTIIDSIHF